MKTKKVIFSILMTLFVISLKAEIRPQGGIESYLGPNKYFSFTPWTGIRISLNQRLSLLVKYYHHDIKYEYTNDLDETVERKAILNNFTAALYTQQWGHDFYAAVTYLTGTDDYSALALDAGTELHLLDKIAINLGIYYLNESSILWYPEDERHRISIYSIKGEIRYTLFNGLSLGPTFNYYRNSEDVNAFSYGILLQYIPKEPFYINFAYYYYSESAQYRFSGHFFTFGINIYY